MKVHVGSRGDDHREWGRGKDMYSYASSNSILHLTLSTLTWNRTIYQTLLSTMKSYMQSILHITNITQ